MVFLRSYREHPSSWGEIIDAIKDNINLLPEKTRDLYRTASTRKLRERLSTKLSKLLRTANVEDEDIR